jgi:DNA/RNA-binding domain of Phe-tRNA-synthetase-like protein
VSRVRLRIAPEIGQRFPSYRALVVHAQELQSGDSDAQSVATLRAAEAAQRQLLAGRKPAEHPHMLAWRDAYRAFGLKPSRYLNSAEALLTRTLRGDDVPAINRLVDLYNAVSIKYVIPAGGEDASQVAGEPTLCVAAGAERFDTMRNGAPAVEHPEPGEVVWVDGRGVTCRAWNWRQGRRTRLTAQTRDAYFILDRLDPLPLEQLEAAGQELAALLRRASPGCVVEIELLRAF